MHKYSTIFLFYTESCSVFCFCFRSFFSFHLSSFDYHQNNDCNAKRRSANQNHYNFTTAVITLIGLLFLLFLYFYLFSCSFTFYYRSLFVHCESKMRLSTILIRSNCNIILHSKSFSWSNSFALHYVISISQFFRSCLSFVIVKGLMRGRESHIEVVFVFFQWSFILDWLIFLK